MTYRRVQRGPLGWLMLALAIGLGSLGITLGTAGGLGVVIGVLAGVCAVLAASMGRLTVEDRGEHLSVRYGPLPLFGTSLQYSTIIAVRTGRTSVIDGLGIHYVPRRGWTYNLWGRDCVEIQTNATVVRVGTDDAAGLAGFLRGRVNLDAPAFERDAR